MVQLRLSSRTFKGKISGRTLLLLAVLIVTYMYTIAGYKPVDNSDLKKTVVVLQTEVSKLKEELKKSKVVSQSVKLLDRWDVYRRLRVMGVPVERTQLDAEGRVVYSVYAKKIVYILREVQKCREIFGDSCVVVSLQPLRLAIYAKQ